MDAVRVLLFAVATAWTLWPASPDAATLDEELIVAEELYRTVGPSEALPLFEGIAERAKDTDTHAYAMAVGFVGECHWRLGEFNLADEFLQQALVLKRELGDRAQEAKTINVMGLLAWHRGRFPEAIANFELAANVGREIGDRKLEGAALNNLSLVGDELGDYHASLARYEQVLEIFREIGFPRGEGDVLGNIGGVNLLLGRFSDAERYYRQALLLSEKLGSNTSLSQDHGNLAMALVGAGRIAEAIEHFDQASKFATAAGIKRDEAYWQRGKGNALVLAGRYDGALALYRQALATYRAIGADPEQVEALNDLGELYLRLGDAGSAELSFEEAADIASRIGFTRALTRNLLALGDLAARRERNVESTALYEQALARAKEAGEMAAWSEALLRLALLPASAADRERASERARLALEIARETGAATYEGRALYALAELARDGDPAAALRYYADAGRVAKSIDDPELAWQVHYGRARTLVTRNDLNGAVQELQLAIAVIEDVRERLKEARFRTGYVQDKYQVYVDLVRLQLELGKTADAFGTAERLRSRGYLMLVESRDALTEEEGNRESELRTTIRQLQDSLDEEQSRARPERRERAIATFSEELNEAEREYEALLDDHRRTHRRYGVFTTPVTYDTVKTRIAADEALVEYVVDEDAVIAFVVTARSLGAVTLALAKTDLASKIELLRDLLHRRDNDLWTKPAASLGRALIEPLVASPALAGVRKLNIVPHDVMNYLPFDLLPLGPGVLMDRFALAYLPTAATLAMPADGGEESNSMLVVAPSRSRLQHAGEEAKAVDALFRPASRLLIGGAATETAFYSFASQFRNLHVVTHGYFNKQNPLLSGLELEPDESEDGLLEVHEIMGLELAVDLVALSACQTGLGTGHFAELPAGDDFVGLTRAFLYAGSRNVLATLWEVDDRSTSLLMERFYRHLATAPHIDKATALARAQRELRADAKHVHPYYWAAFVLVGNTSTTSQSERKLREIRS
jgi:CHAT domain-containing protein/Flp pilus assembly protein TadD